MLSVRLNADLEEKLDKLSESTSRSKSFYVKQALERYLKDVDDYFEVKSRDNNTENKFITIEEIEKSVDEWKQQSQQRLRRW